MGIYNVHFLLPSLWLFFFLITAISSSYAQNAPPPPSPPPPPAPPPPLYGSRDSTFRQSIAIVVVVALLTIIFSITFLLLLYVKHCKSNVSSTGGGWTSNAAVMRSSSFRKNSGIDRTVIESLPVFRFGSLRGQKAEGLECAVCLSKFESNEILRLLPKCKHAFHVECVDTWLDAHSTCPLCRYQVDPEDILLVSHERSKSISSNSPGKEKQKINQFHSSRSSSAPACTRHSSAGEKCTGNSSSSSLQIIVETPKEENQESENQEKLSSLSKRRMSLDSWNLYRKKFKSSSTNSPASLTRKDGMLLNKPEEHRRLEHRIIISGDQNLAAATAGTSAEYRWSDVEACDMLYLRSEMILSESGRYSGSRKRTVEIEGRNGSGRGVINGRSVSEMTGMSRFRSNEEREIQRKGAVTRWLDWISQSQNKSVTDNHESVSGVVTASPSTT